MKNADKNDLFWWETEEKLTNFEIQKEWQYRMDERMAVFSGPNRDATVDQQNIARKEADQWRMDYHKQLATQERGT